MIILIYNSKEAVKNACYIQLKLEKKNVIIEIENILLTK